ncbi:ferredoxin [Mycobacterium spongiae]|uniref:Ferredoxin n=1 Tax=Mycobacterium spongiae TaxID=886343 RepID=A0A975PXF1_9MYCO|nr:ferredoxin [Mycobacterium spongiae]QUR67693.1 ferredoxin [Mycobacterium spongiae]
MKVRADRDVCMATGVCVMTADGFFDQDADGLVVLAVDEVPAGEEGRVRNAVRLCPSGALGLVSD